MKLTIDGMEPSAMPGTEMRAWRGEPVRLDSRPDLGQDEVTAWAAQVRELLGIKGEPSWYLCSMWG